MPQQRTIVTAGGGRVLLLGVFGLGLVYQFLLLLVLVLVVLGLLRGGDGALVGESVEDTDGKGGPPQNLKRVVLENGFHDSNATRVSSAGSPPTAGVWPKALPAPREKVLNVH